MLLMGACDPGGGDTLPPEDTPASAVATAALVNGTLVNGQPVSGLSASTGAELVYTLSVPENQNLVTFTMTGSNGNADMYVSFGTTPTTTTAQCSSTATGSNGTCTVAGRSSTGTWYVLIKATSTFSGLSLTGSYTPNGTGSGTTKVLADNQATKVSGALGEWVLYTMEVPSLQSALNVTTSGGTGEVDLYLRQGSAPTLTTFDCRSRNTGTTDGCSVSRPKAGTWYVMLRGYSAFSNVNLLGAVVAFPETLSIGQPLTNVSVAKGASRYFTVNVPTGQSLLKVTLAGGTGDADLYLQRVNAPTTATYTCVSRAGGNTESCSVTNPQAGTWHIVLYGYSASAGAALMVTTTGGGPIGLPLTNGQPLIIDSTEGGPFVYRIDVPADTGNLTIEVSFLFSGAYDLFVRYGSEPTTGVYDCSRTYATSRETCSFDKPRAGTWYVHILPGYPYNAFSYLNLVGTYGGRVATTPLQNGQATAPVTEDPRDFAYYTLEVPAGQKRLAFWMTGGTGYPYVYAKLGGIPVETQPRCSLISNGPCIIENPQPGTWYFWPTAMNGFQNVSLTAEYTADTTQTPEPLRKDEPRTGLAGTPLRPRLFVLEVPPNQLNLRLQTSGGTGVARLRAKRGALPTASTYDCAYSCDIERPEGGTWYVQLEGESTYSDVTLSATYATPVTAPDMEYAPEITNYPSRRYFKMDVPPASIALKAYTGGRAETKLYVRRGRLPSPTEYDCVSMAPGKVKQECNINAPQAGEWFALVEFVVTYPEVPESFFWEHLETGPISDIEDGVPALVSGPPKSFRTLRFQVPEGAPYLFAELLDARLTPKSAYAYLYVRHESDAANGFAVCRSTGLCDLPNPRPGTWYLTVQVPTYGGPTADFSGAVRATTTGRALRPLVNAIAESLLDSAQNVTHNWRFEVPVGATDVLFQLNGTDGNSDLYVKHGSPASASSYDCASANTPGSEETCAITQPQPGTWYVTVVDRTGPVGWRGPTVRATYAMSPGEGIPELTPYASRAGLSAPKYSQKMWKLEVPPGQSTLWFATEHGSGTVNLKVKRGGRAVTGQTFDCTTTGTGNLKQCLLTNPQPGTWFVTLTGDEAYEFVTLTGGYFQADTVTSLTNAIPATNLRLDAGKAQYFHLDVPANAAMYSFELRFDTTATAEEIDVRIQQGTLPTTTSQRCAYLAKGSVRCAVASPAAGPWYARVLSASKAFDHVRVGAFHGPRLDDAPLLLNQDYFLGVSGSSGTVRTYKVIVPEGTGTFTVSTGYNTTGGQGTYYGNLSLAVRKDAPPTATERDCAYPFPSPSSTCSINNPAPGTYFVSLTLTDNSYNLWVLPNAR
ncbi:PPC domain-containing protein [Myxococcus sp. K15C18031901]|uniref:PPC domain-containing protein n=1 Tax=Myxococcus dinghuensis TaxID=2906761 RepID=UPI0020A7B188|nr:PPC domain-containing protein [Myxococcus dinghuensis]MCP3102345.1 PPC domain-containing protein [Myxococcus dinghuensis]